MALTLELLLLEVEWGASNPTKPKCKNFVDCTIYDRGTMVSKSYRLDVGGTPVAVKDVSEKENCFLWLRISQEKKNLLGQLKQAPIEGVDFIGLDLAQPPNLSPNYRVPNAADAKVNLTLQARWMGGKRPLTGRRPAPPPPCVAAKGVPKWQFFREEDSKWVDYGPEFNKCINQSVEAGFTSFKCNGISFVIDGQTGTHKNRKSGHARPMRCVDHKGSPYDYMLPWPPAVATPNGAAPAPPEFTALGPFGVIPYVNLMDLLQVHLSSHRYVLQWPLDLGPPFTLLASPAALAGRLSPETRLPPMSEADARRACIPRNARAYVFIYPLEGLVGLNGLDFHDPRHALLSLGGFLYLDGNKQCLAINGLTATGEGLYFGPRYKVAKKACPTHVKDRMSAVVFPGLAAVGAQRFVWLSPEDEFPGLPVRNVNGGILFDMIHDAEHFAYFAVQSLDPVGTLFLSQTIAQCPGQLKVAAHAAPQHANGTLVAHEPDNVPPPPPLMRPIPNWDSE